MNVGVVGNPIYDEIRDVLSRLAALATRWNLVCYLESGLAAYWPGPTSPFSLEEDTQKLDLLVTFGGDGTLLRGARVLAHRDVPILGVNLGRVGFLNTTEPDALEDSVARFCKGEYSLQSHSTLVATIHREDETDQEIGVALNDVVVHKRGTARVVRLSVSIDGDVIGQYSADGIIVATPTGSTAYSLSAGGPIVVPNVEALVVTAICPHTLAVRPIVIPASSEVRIAQAVPISGDILVSIDGQISTTLSPGELLVTRRGAVPKRLVRFERERFFERVRNKLQWGDLSGREIDQDAH